MATQTTTVLLPMQLTAYILNQDCCNSKNFKIAPITQPNYTFLRLHENLLTSDTLDHVDIHSASPANLNQRVFNLGENKVRDKRLGVYLHWTLPQLYRTGVAGVGKDANTEEQAELKRQQGYPASSSVPTSNDEIPDYSTPDFRLVPNRWLITRRLTSKVPADAPIDPFQAWIVESDTITNINDMSQDADIENEYTPFVKTNPKDLKSQNEMLIDGQAEIFIGKKTPLSQWRTKTADEADHVDLDVMSSSNPIFSDYTHHNMNVFTIADNFQYGDGKYLTSATADYSVIGWHSKDDADPMTTYRNGKSNTLPTHADRLKSCTMKMKDQSMKEVQDWLAANNNSMYSRILCHGSMYQVEYSTSGMPIDVGAEASGLKMKSEHPISIGITPVDAILAYCRAQLKDGLDDPTLHSFEEDLLALSSLLMGVDGDNVEGFRAASDESYKQAFTKIEAGIKWVYKQQNAPGARPDIPDKTKKGNLLTLNALQQTRNIAARELDDLRWALFARWWNYISGFVDNEHPEIYKKLLNDVKDKLDSMVLRIQDLDKNINDLKAKKEELLDLSEAAGDYFYQRKDPTVMFNNVGRGWDKDFVETSQVRIHSSRFSQLVVNSPSDPELSRYLKALDDTDSDGNARLPADLVIGVKALVVEFCQLKKSYAGIEKPKQPGSMSPGEKVNEPVQLVQGQVLPYYHTPFINERARDFWGWTQPWKPLMIEWEAIYYHVPFENWNFREFDNLSQWGATSIHYGPNTELSNVQDIKEDRRHISGRNILLPQASSTLTVALKTIFDNTSKKDLITSLAAAHSDDKDVKVLELSEDEQQEWLVAEKQKLLETISSLDIVSAPMSGFTSHILTMHEGSHVKPSIKLPNRASVPIDAAATGLAKALTANSTNKDVAKANALNMIRAMQEETTLTPYGASVQSESNKKSPFKPVTHGQLIFTKVNIIDKFGQVVSAIDPRPQRRGASFNPVFPCLADTYYPGTLNELNPERQDARPNTITKQTTNACPFISLTPAINQPARINANFVQKIDGKWRRCSEWDDPIWGWLVVNYPDNGLQIFFADGTFYREVRLGGKVGTSAGRKFLPFDKPKGSRPDIRSQDIVQLDALIEKLATPNDPSYLQGVIDMILQSLDDKQAHAPRSYATNASAIVGKPLALVNAGWSLELANPENTNWSLEFTDPDKKDWNSTTTILPDRTLLDNGTLLADGVLVSTDKSRNPDASASTKNESGRVFETGDPRGYTFPIKLGDAERSFDGLVGYFPSYDKDHLPEPGEPESDLNLRKLYTYFVKSLEPPESTTLSTDPRISLVPKPKNTSPILTPLELSPYHLTGYVDPADLKHHDAQLKVFGLIIDPFMPVHAYSSILPNKSLKLPPWSVEQALNRMTAFWQAGPLIITQDVAREYNENWAVTDYYTQIIAPPKSSTTPAQATATATDVGIPPPGGVIDPTPVKPNADLTIPLVSIPLAPPVGSTSGAEAVYRWLQPYWVENPEATSSTNSNSKPKHITRFTALGVSDDSASAADAATLRFEKGPYTAVEGYIQVAKPLGTSSGQVQVVK